MFKSWSTSELPKSRNLCAGLYDTQLKFRYIDGTQLKSVNHFKYLGSAISSDGTPNK